MDFKVMLRVGTLNHYVFHWTIHITCLPNVDMADTPFNTRSLELKNNDKVLWI